MSNSTSVSAVATLGHVGLNVSNLERSVAFYQRAFGLHSMGGAAKGQQRYAFLGDTQSVLLTLWEQSTGSADYGLPGLHHLALQLADVAALERLEQDLRAQQVPIFYEGIVPHAEGDD